MARLYTFVVPFALLCGSNPSFVIIDLKRIVILGSIPFSSIIFRYIVCYQFCLLRHISSNFLRLRLWLMMLFAFVYILLVPGYNSLLFNPFILVLTTFLKFTDKLPLWFVLHTFARLSTRLLLPIYIYFLPKWFNNRFTFYTRNWWPCSF